MCVYESERERERRFGEKFSEIRNRYFGAVYVCLCLWKGVALWHTWAPLPPNTLQAGFLFLCFAKKRKISRGLSVSIPVPIPLYGANHCDSSYQPKNISEPYQPTTSPPSFHIPPPWTRQILQSSLAVVIWAPYVAHHIFVCYIYFFTNSNQKQSPWNDIKRDLVFWFRFSFFSRLTCVLKCCFFRWKIKHQHIWWSTISTSFVSPKKTKKVACWNFSLFSFFWKRTRPKQEKSDTPLDVNCFPILLHFFGKQFITSHASSKFSPLLLT